MPLSPLPITPSFVPLDADLVVGVAGCQITYLEATRDSDRRGELLFIPILARDKESGHLGKQYNIDTVRRTDDPAVSFAKFLAVQYLQRGDSLIPVHTRPCTPVSSGARLNPG